LRFFKHVQQVLNIGDVFYLHRRRCSHTNVHVMLTTTVEQNIYNLLFCVDWFCNQISSMSLPSDCCSKNSLARRKLNRFSKPFNLKMLVVPQTLATAYLTSCSCSKVAFHPTYSDHYKIRLALKPNC